MTKDELSASSDSASRANALGRGQAAARLEEQLHRLGVVREVGDRDAAVDEREVEIAVEVDVRPGHAPAGRAAEGRSE